MTFMGFQEPVNNFLAFLVLLLVFGCFVENALIVMCRRRKD